MARAAASFALAIAIVAATPTWAQPAPPAMTQKEYREAIKRQIDAITAANKAAVEKLGKLSAEMEALGMKGEVGDCKRILDKCLDPGKSLHKGGGNSPWPGEEVYFTRVLDRFAEVGRELSVLYADAAAAAMEPADLREQLEVVSLWLGTFPELAKHMRHFNQRRKECKLGPVTNSWSSSYGGFMHGRYMALNANDPSTAGLGGHNESPQLRGSSPEGAAAAKGIGGGPWFDGWMGSMYHREPVFEPGLSRVAYGGFKGSYWCSGAGSGNQQLSNLITWPGDGATNISGMFGGEHPNPLPKGVDHTGTMIIIQFYGGKPKEFSYRLLDPSGKAITDQIEFSKNPVVFAPRQVLTGGTYKVELLGVDYKQSFSFTVGGGPWNGESSPPPRQPEPTAKADPKKPDPGIKMPVEPDEPEKTGAGSDEPAPKVEPKPEDKPKPEVETGTPVERAFKRVVKATEEDRPDRIAELYLAWVNASAEDKLALAKAVGVDALRGKGLPQAELSKLAEAVKQ